MEKAKSIQLRDENIYPDEKVLQSVLGDAFSSYKKLLELFACNDMNPEWRYYNDGKAWLCKVQLKKRTIVWMSAWPGFMKTTMYFSQKHQEKAFSLESGKELKELILYSQDVGKSKEVSFEIYDESLLETFKKVMLLKIQCK